MSLVNGLGFYESINKLIIGFLLLFLFVKPDFESSQGVLFLILAYITGCIYQAIIRSMTKSWLNLRECEIAKAYKDIYKFVNCFLHWGYRLKVTTVTGLHLPIY